jgi:3-hydroxyisobutyrate dehydrogenase-like beta-hydroxyacid dehydrogenase
MTTVGFIGLGLMGAGFIKRLAATGYEIVAYDIDAGKVAMATAWGVAPARSPADAIRRADIVAICVTTTAAVEAVVSGEDGLLSAGKLRAKTVVDFSTTEMAATHRIAQALARAGAAFIDAPVSGGPGAAENGTLAIMAGGDAAAVEGARPMLERLGQVTHMGGTGAGQATKLVNQALCLTNYVVVAEGLRLAEAFGVDLRKIPEALAPGYANSAVLQSIYPRMVDKDFAPRGYARQVLKDLEMLHEATRAQHLALPMTSLATTLFRILVAQGKSELDAAAIVTLIPEPKRAEQ